MLFSKKWNLKTSNCRLLFHKKLDRSSTQKWYGFWCALCSIFHKITTYTSFTQLRISNSPLPVLYKYFKHFTRLNVSPICRKSCNIKCSELISILQFKKKRKKKRLKHILSSILSTTFKFKFNHDLSVTLIAKIIE